MFYIYNNQLLHKPEKTHKLIEHSRGSLKNLKEFDPVLYNFKRYYKTENVYSKICQKPYQPVILDKHVYKKLDNAQKARTVKYWNFTTNSDTYYLCPNHKYPYVKFITKRHPQDFCIPCCKKSVISSNKKDPKRVIHDICLKSHKYMKEERTITLGSRYIMSYGKDVEPGRLSRLPEDSLEPLFYETYSVDEKGVDSECATTDGYYLYGVSQTINGTSAGIFNILTNSLEITYDEFILKIIKKLKDSPSKFRVLLDGKINVYFRNIQDFISTLNSTFLEPSGLTNKNIPWNSIFISIAYLFLNINVIYFAHVRNTDIKMMLPSYVTSKEQFLSKEFKNIIVSHEKQQSFSHLSAKHKCFLQN